MGNTRRTSAPSKRKVISRHDKRRSRAGLSAGLTLVEVVLVIAIVSLLVTISIPAIQAAREAARQTQCMNNLHQFGLAFAGFESQQGAFPSGFTARITGPVAGDSKWEIYSYMADLLPFLDAQATDSAYHRNAMFCAPENASAIGTALKIAICPSGPDRDLLSTATFVPSLAVSQSVRDYPILSGVFAKLDKKYTATYRGGITDYAVPLSAEKGLAKRFGYDIPNDDFVGLQGMFPLPLSTVQKAIATFTPILAGSGTVELQRRLKAAEITDGMSHTFMLTEVAGRPQRWQNGTWTGVNEPLNAAWADPRTVLAINGVTTGKGTCLMQCDNQDEIYSFHPSGVNFLFADGHAQIASANTDPRVILAWLSPDRADAGP
jgi:prepilin-type processing-associated H-X9-DG protein